MYARTGDNEKLGNTFFPKGKDNAKTAKVCCGDIGVFTKLASVRTGDTLCQPGKLVTIKPMTYAEPCYRMAIYAKTKGQEDKVAAGLVKLNEEDASFTYGNDPETKEMIIAGVCDIHLSVIIAKLLSKYKVEAELRPAKIAYRETIKKKVEIHGRHKKQSGGHGQFGDVYIRFEPQSESEDMIFADETVGGCVPKNFIPSVEKGLRNCIGKGVLAGYPVVFLKSTLYFGSYHPVDSSDMAFQTAAGIAYKEGLPTAGPTLLEPIGELKVFIPDAHGRYHRRPQQAPRPRDGHEPRSRQPRLADRRGRGTHGRNEQLRHRPAFHVAGPRLLQPQVRPLRGGPADQSGEDHRGRQEGRRGIIQKSQWPVREFAPAIYYRFFSHSCSMARKPHCSSGRSSCAS